MRSKDKTTTIVRLGSAKRLTRGGFNFSIELNMQPREFAG